MKKLWIGVSISGVILLAAFVILLDIPSWKSLDISKITDTRTASVIYDKNGREAALLGGSEAGILLKPDEIPEMVKNAFIAAEDQRFYEHCGVDIRRIFGALFQDLKSLSFREGASTITQQLIKLTHLTQEKTVSRKGNEMYLALQLEKKLSKDEILTAYLNTAYFGAGAYGIESAARTYFQKSTDALTLSESAMLAGILKAPSAYSPMNSMEKALERQKYVLEKMLALNMIDENEKQEAENQKIEISETRENSSFGWYRDYVMEEASEALGITVDELLTGGYAIYTEFSEEDQKKADALFLNAANFPDDAADGTPAQAAFCLIDNETGAIRALIGGRKYETARGLNRAYQTKRQPGSALKPVSVFAAAIDGMGMNPSSITDDTKRTFDGGYSPSNAGGRYYGLVTLREALSRSLNVASVSLMEFCGIQQVRSYAMRAGIPLEDEDNGLALALGSLTSGVTPLQLAQAYAPLANGGRSVRAHAVEKICDKNGKCIYQFAPSASRVMKTESAYLLTGMLKTAASVGSAKALSAAGIPIAGKTGTVSVNDEGNRDLWTCAYTPTETACVWMGFDRTDETHMLPSWTGGSGHPAKLLAAFFTGKKAVEFEKPPGIENVMLDRIALENEHRTLLASENAPAELTVQEEFRKGSAPKQYSKAFLAPEKPGGVKATALSDEKVMLTIPLENDNCEYLIFVADEEGKRLVETVSGEAGAVYEGVFDMKSEREVYTVIARNRLMHEYGISLLSEESDELEVFIKKSLKSRMEDLFEGLG